MCILKLQEDIKQISQLEINVELVDELTDNHFLVSEHVLNGVKEHLLNPSELDGKLLVYKVTFANKLK